MNIETNSSNIINASQPHLSVEAIVLSVLNEMLTKFQDPKKGMRILSKKMGIHEKTLTRLKNGENKPSYQTVFKIYRVYFNEFNDAKILELVPKEIQEFLIKSNPQVLNKVHTYTTSADLELQKNPVVAEIFVLAGTGAISLEEVEFRFGKYGVEILGRMIDKGLIIEVHKGVFALGNNQPNFEGSTIVAVGKALIDAHAKPENGEEVDKNFISFYAEGLSDEAYKEWLRIDAEAFAKKYNLTREQKNLGHIRAFTFMISETMELKDKQ